MKLVWCRCFEEVNHNPDTGFTIIFNRPYATGSSIAYTWILDSLLVGIKYLDDPARNLKTNNWFESLIFDIPFINAIQITSVFSKRLFKLT